MKADIRSITQIGERNPETKGDKILFTLKINNVTRRNRIEIIGELTQDEKQKLFELLGIK